MLITTSASPPATIVLDFGKEVDGTPFAKVSAWQAAGGSPVTLRVATSEALPFLFNTAAGLYQHTDSRPNVFPLDTNMNAIRLGVVPADKVQGILAYFKAR